MPERSKILRCKTSFTTLIDGRRVAVAAGDLYHSDDPVVQGRERHFGELVVKSTAPAAARATETATAAPGERRRMARPAKAADAKPEEGKADAKRGEGETGA